MKVGNVQDPFGDFCQGLLWDSNVSWNTDTPDFTNCFQQTVLVWIPCCFLWITLPFTAYNSFRSSRRADRWTWLSSTKMVLSLLLTIIAIADASFIVNQWSNHGTPLANAELLAALLKAGTFFLSAVYIYLDRRNGNPSSVILFFFWLSLLVEATVLFRSKLIFAENILKRDFQFVTCMIYFLLVCCQFLLSCIAGSFSEWRSSGANPCPEKSASIPSRLTFWWFTSLAYLGWKRPLEQNDLWDLNSEDRTHVSVVRLAKNWKDEQDKARRSNGATSREPSLIRTLFKTFWVPVIASGVLKLGGDMLAFVAPLILQSLIEFVTNRTVQTWKGYFYAALMLMASAAQTLIIAHYFHISTRVGMHARSAVVAVLYRKALKISNSVKRTSTVGQMVNLISVDSQRLTDIVPSIHYVWSSLLQAGIAVYLLWLQLGPAVLAGLAVIVLSFPLNALIARKTQTFQISLMDEKDGRIKLMSEILSGIKALKLYAWEECYQKRVGSIRERELMSLLKASRLDALSTFVWVLSPVLVTLVSFGTYVLIPGNVLDPQKAFVSLSLFNILRFPLSMLPAVITSVVQAKVSIDRLTKFLRNEELDEKDVRRLESHDLNMESAVTIRRGNFSWAKDEPPVLRNIDLDIKEGQLVAIVGQVGAGKSSLIAAMLGLMEKSSGDAALKGSVAYVSQQAWIQNLTLKENILFGSSYDELRYNRVIDACALRPDLELLPAGDLTEIGEKGINLSGGQKQRVALARAVYSGADVFFLDDPLSAVDSNVSRYLFEHVIGPNGMLAGKTRILVTHGVSYLPKTDLIIVLDKGNVTEKGPYFQLLRNQGVFSKFLLQYSNNEEDSENSNANTATGHAVKERLTQDSVKAALGKKSEQEVLMTTTPQTLASSADGKPAKPRNGGLISTEKSESGQVKWSVYVLFLKHMSYPCVAGVALLYFMYTGFSAFTNIWLGQWSEDGLNPAAANDTTLRDYRLGVYGALGGAQGIFFLCSSLLMVVGQIRASRLLHQNMLTRILRAPMTFFDQTPIGRIVNRFSADIMSVDVMLPMSFRMWLNCVFQILATVIIICISIPLFAVVILPLGFFYYFVQRFFIATSRQLKRLEAVSRSPIYSHFQESVQGSSVIIATNQVDRFITENEDRVDVSNSSYYAGLVSQRWQSVLLEALGNCITFFAALFAVIGRDRDWGVNPKDVGLSISYALTITQLLNWVVRMTSQLETNVVSVERIKEYTEIEQEADWVVPFARSDEWPPEGHVQFIDYETKYRPDLEAVLKGVTADVRPGEKIGIVGRTGAGKSSLTLALFRIIEPTGGTIVIDGVDINQIGLHDLRSRITIIPQDPVLFSGTLRMNLDPVEISSDEDIWRALQDAHLKGLVDSLPDGLDHAVAEGGENLSVGQRQMVCLARALLRKSKVLILDEATAAIDLETDHLIQQTIQEKCDGCTVFTIAHRLNTVLDSTRVMVLDQGFLREFDSPGNLLSNKQSIFYGLAKDANVVN